MDYMTGGTPLPPYFPYPRFLLGSGLSQTAQILYAVLLDRSRVSCTNDWTDEKGHVFIVYPVDKLAQTMHKSITAVKRTLLELEQAGYIERHRSGNGQHNRLYIKQTDHFQAPRQPENGPSDSPKTGCHSYYKE